MEAHTTCPICDHLYNSLAKRPLVLPCSHSFCQECLQQVEAAGDKRCPLCRESWSDVRLSDLLSCYQLLSTEGKTVEMRYKRAKIDVFHHKDACGEHELPLDIWCESCEVSECKKCWRRDHRDCKIMLLEEKIEVLREFSSIRFYRLKEEALIKYKLNNSNNSTDLAAVNVLMEKFIAIGKGLVQYKASLDSWKSELDKVVTNYVSHDSNIQTLCDNVAVLEKIESQFPGRPSSLPQSIANAYQNSGDDAEAFITNLRSVLDASAKPVNRTSLPTASPTACQSLAAAAEALKDGEVWTIANRISAAAFRHVLHNTSTRPKRVEMTYTDIPKHTLQSIKILCGHKQYQVDVKVVMDGFAQFQKPSAETIAATASKINDLVKWSGWATLTQFWGHLDAAAVQKLPATIKNAGLVLRDQQDMAAVNALFGTIVQTDNIQSAPDRPMLPHLAQLDLSLATTFRPGYWKKTWDWATHIVKPFIGPAQRRPPPPAAASEGRDVLFPSRRIVKPVVVVRLHLPQLVPGDRHWMGNLFKVMGLKDGGFKKPVPLLLPGARLDPDPLLGVLRDSGHLWEVHLPANLPQLEMRKEVDERYKSYGHSVVWDLK